jgi:hypothetical protein
MQPSTISFLDRCPICNKNVSASPTLGREELIAALAANTDVRVTHIVAVGDHVWSLNDQQKSNLRKLLAEGLI